MKEDLNPDIHSDGTCAHVQTDPVPSPGLQIYGRPGPCPMISKYGPSLSTATGQADPSFLVVKISDFNKKYSTYSESINSTKQKVHVGCQLQ